MATKIDVEGLSPVEAKVKVYASRPVVGRFRILAGKHQEGYNEDGSLKVYKKGEVVESKYDLTKLNPPDPKAWKFEPLDTGRGKGKSGSGIPTNLPAAPGGQVTSGFQQTTQGPSGEQVSGPMETHSTSESSGPSNQSGKSRK